MNQQPISNVTAAGTYLPAAYLSQMEKLLGREYEEFLSAMQEPSLKGLRFNALRARPETVRKLKEEWDLKEVPWCPGGFTFDAEKEEELRPGLSPYHDAGIYYMQEPSAMVTGALAGKLPGEAVLDLCAAPGGKTSALAEQAGILVSNEYVEKRARVLSSNVERMGYRNVIVTNASPEELADALPAYFDKIVVDAPCSGEGMMRKDPTAVAEWSEENVKLCAERQRMILDQAVRMLKDGGYLIYSTCTFEPCENEEQAERLAALYGFRILSMETLYPHRVRGEGHFCVVLQKPGTDTTRDGIDRSGAWVPGDALRCTGKTSRSQMLAGFCTAFLKSAASRRAGILGSISDPRSCRPCPAPAEPARATDSEAPKLTEGSLWEAVNFGHGGDGGAPRYQSDEKTIQELAKMLRKAGVHVLRAGVERGTVVKGKHRGEERYEPSHAEAKAAEWESCENRLDLNREADALRYLRGESIDLNGLPEDAYELSSKEGFLTVFYDRYPLGLGKLVGHTVKNHYPKGLRHLK